MGLTVEEVDAMQDEMHKIGDDDADAVAAAEAVKLAEAKAVEDATQAKAKEEADVVKAKADADGKAKDEDIDVIRELKEQVRASNEALRKVTGDYQKLHKVMLDKGLLTDEEVKASEAEETAAKAAYAERQNKLGEMVAIMELNPTYVDVRQVCSQGNLDDLVDAFARYYVKENGGDLQTAAQRIESELWSEPNPYKKMYELIKQYHPKYKVADAADATKAKEAEDAAKKIAAEADKVKDKKIIDAQASAANMGAGGSGAGGGGWTVAKIDALPEDELSTVPKDIYEKYLNGTLT
jgi:hypothetical protein